MKKLLLATALMAGSIAGQPASAVTFVTSSANPGLQAPTGFGSLPFYADFNSGAPAGLTGGSLKTGSNDSIYSAPFGDGTQYYAVGPEAGTPANLAISGFNRLSLYWGSIDAGNTLSFLGAGGVVLQSFTGNQITMGGVASGAESANVTFSLNPAEAAAVTGIRFTSSLNAFEFDNLAIGTSAVPEAAAWAMMIVGLGVIGGSVRRRRKITMRAAFA